MARVRAQRTTAPANPERTFSAAADSGLSIPNIGSHPAPALLPASSAKPSQSHHRKLSAAGNPGMDNLAAFFHAIRQRLKVNFEPPSLAA
jgi:hypothetical protein